MTQKSPDAFRTISEAAEELDLPQHVLRHWEETFGAIRPMRRAGGRRFYRTHDLELISGVRALLHEERYTTKGVQKIFKDQGAAYVAEIGRKVMKGETMESALGLTPGNSKTVPVEDLRSLLTKLRSLKENIRSLRLMTRSH